MSMKMYAKHPDYMGKDLKIMVGRGDQTIFDNVVLEGSKWDRFVAMGFLRRCTDEEVADILRGRGEKPEPEPEPESDPEPATAAEKKAQAKAEKDAAAERATEEQARAEADTAEAKARQAAADANESSTKSPASKVQPGTGGARKRSAKDRG